MAQINGRPAQALVDTGATVVAMSAMQADMLGIVYRDAPRSQVSTANGQADVWRIRLATLRIGDVTLFDIEAVVSAAAMPYVLLGNSFLGRFQMTRNNDQLILERRF
jgi:aspartyl protease family protein